MFCIKKTHIFLIHPILFFGGIFLTIGCQNRGPTSLNDDKSRLYSDYYDTNDDSSSSSGSTSSSQMPQTGSSVLDSIQDEAANSSGDGASSPIVSSKDVSAIGGVLDNLLGQLGAGTGDEGNKVMKQLFSYIMPLMSRLKSEQQDTVRAILYGLILVKSIILKECSNWATNIAKTKKGRNRPLLRAAKASECFFANLNKIGPQLVEGLSQIDAKGLEQLKTQLGQ